MTDELKQQINELKQGITDWPQAQKGSYVGGVCDGLSLAVLIAKESGCDIHNIVKDKFFEEFMNFLDHNYSPIKRRSKTAEEPKPARDQLVDDIKKLLWRSIACRLRIPKETFDTSLDAEDVVNRWFLTIVAIANRSALDDAIQDIRVMRSIAGGGVVDRESVKAEVETCDEKFPTEITAIERFNELSKRSNFKLKDIWINLRSNLKPLDYGYEDDELAEIDAKYK